MTRGWPYRIRNRGWREAKAMFSLFNIALVNVAFESKLCPTVALLLFAIVNRVCRT